MRFKVIPKCFQDASHSGHYSQSTFLLEENDWNDYGYITMYHLHYAGAETDGVATYIGPLRIMKIGQNPYESNLISKLFQRQPDLNIENIDAFLSKKTGHECQV